LMVCVWPLTAQVGVKTRNRGIYDDPDRQFGRESRSLKGCYELFLAGFENVVHLDGGLSGWRHSKRPLEGSRADGGNMFA
jgi:3-mercaptopyruvate sulfurtransferase SseA